MNYVELRTSSYPYNSTTDTSPHTVGSKGHYTAGNSGRLTPSTTAPGSSARQVIILNQMYCPFFLSFLSEKGGTFGYFYWLPLFKYFFYWIKKIIALLQLN